MRRPPKVQPSYGIHGCLRVDEVLAPIHSVRLVPGGVEFQGMAHGPSSPARGRVRMFTTSGEAVTDHIGGNGVTIDIPALSAGQTCVLTYLLTISHLTPGRTSSW